MAYQAELLKRYESYTLNVFELNKVIAVLEMAYEQTLNENVLVSIQMLRGWQQQARDHEIVFNKADVYEIRRNPGAYPHSVVTWAFDYYDQEIS